MRDTVLFMLKYSVESEISINLSPDKCEWILAELARLHACVERANQTIEDVCCGTRLECVKCGKPRPCLCQDT